MYPTPIFLSSENLLTHYSPRVSLSSLSFWVHPFGLEIDENRPPPPPPLLPPLRALLPKVLAFCLCSPPSLCMRSFGFGFFAWAEEAAASQDRGGERERRRQRNPLWKRKPFAQYFWGQMKLYFFWSDKSLLTAQDKLKWIGQDNNRCCSWICMRCFFGGFRRRRRKTWPPKDCSKLLFVEWGAFVLAAAGFF